jgi:hypothetical protein
MKARVGGFVNGRAIMPTSSSVTSPAAARPQTTSLKSPDKIAAIMVEAPFLPAITSMQITL